MRWGDRMLTEAVQKKIWRGARRFWRWCGAFHRSPQNRCATPEWVFL